VRVSQAVDFCGESGVKQQQRTITSPTSIFFENLIHNGDDYFKCMQLKQETHSEASQ
jgi:hypothetical protein